MPGTKAWGYLTAPEGNGIHVGVQVCAVLVEIERVASEAAPPFLPALVYQHIQVAWDRRQGDDLFIAPWAKALSSTYADPVI